MILRVDEAVELTHAWIAGLARELGIRVLLIKGPVLYEQGLRRQRTSADTDVLVEPSGFDALCTAIIARGWRERPSMLVRQVSGAHSTTFIHTDWPCDLDVHRFYPGFLAAPAVAFEALWSCRETMNFAHQRCQVPDRAGGVLILALHSMRSTTREPRHRVELDELLRTGLSDSDRTAIASLALATGSAASLSEVLRELGVSVPPPPDELEKDALRLWRERVESGSQGAYFWILALRDATFAGKLALAWRLIWPSDGDIRIGRPGVGKGAWPMLRARAARLSSGIRSLAPTLRAVRRNRRRGRRRGG